MNKPFFIFLFFISSVSKAQIIEPNKELLWEISINGKGPKSYLFGTIHSNDKRVFAFSDSLYIALNNSESIVLETDIFNLFENLANPNDRIETAKKYSELYKKALLNGKTKIYAHQYADLMVDIDEDYNEIYCDI